VELEDISIRQLQHIRSNWLASKGVTGRLDRMNCYIWDGAEWAAEICRDYYNMHIRLFLRAARHSGSGQYSAGQGCSLAPEDEARAMGLKHWLKEGFDPSGFPAPSGLDSLRYLLARKDSIVTGFCAT